MKKGDLLHIMRWAWLQLRDTASCVAKKPTPQKSTNDVIYICLRMPLRNMMLQKVLTRPYAAQGFAYAWDRYDNSLTKHEQESF